MDSYDKNLIVHGLLMATHVLELGNGLDQRGIFVQHLLHFRRILRTKKI